MTMIWSLQGSKRRKLPSGMAACCFRSFTSSFGPLGIVVALDQTVADHGLIEGLERFDALLELLEVEAKVLLTAFQFLGAEQLHRFFGSGGIVRIRMVHGDAVEDGCRWEEQAIVEGVFGVKPVSENDVGDLEGQNCVEVAHLLGSVLGDDPGGVEQALGDEDGVSYGNRLERLREQGAATDRAGEGDVVVGQDIA